ncbi:MAG: hypothetical protein ABIP55_11195 [Tepidisphaeraceae bacterium]
MTDLDFESSQLQLVTDALRAGPGSPQWREALATLEAAPGGDEYKQLYAARERLASGKSYREVHAGQGFTRKVFDAIEDEESATPATLPSANLIAAVSALVILGILAAVAWFVIPRAATERPQELAQTYFVTTRAQSTFDSELGMEWAAFGPLAVMAQDGLRAVPVESSPDAGYRGGGVFYERTLAPGETFALEASIKHLQSSEDLVVQLFVADDRNFSGETATSPHELVWSLRGGEASVVMPDGTVESPGVKIPAGPSARVDVRIAINKTEAAVEMNGRRLWSGANPLDPAKPRLLGVRFLARGGEGQERAAVESVRVLVPQKQ